MRSVDDVVRPLSLVMMVLFSPACGLLWVRASPDPELEPGFTSVASADLNGDGNLDIAASYLWLDESAPLTAPDRGFVVAYMQDSTTPGNFLDANVYPVGTSTESLSVGDVNADGKLDVVTVNTDAVILSTGDQVGANDVSILLQDPDRSVLFLPQANYSVGTSEGSGSLSPRSIALGDLDRDPWLDVAVTYRDGISLLLQDPRAPGRFLSPMELDLGAAARSVAIADLDGNGKADLAATTRSSVAVLLQDPDAPGASFHRPAAYAAGFDPEAIAIADIDDDGRPDLAFVSGGGPGRVVTLLQSKTARGTFDAPIAYATLGNSSADVAIADLNGDGKQDLAVANSGGGVPVLGNSMAVLLQEPALPGRFQPAMTYPAGRGFVSALAIADLNRDGMPDVVAVEDGTLITKHGPVIWFQDPAAPGTFLPATLIPN